MNEKTNYIEKISDAKGKYIKLWCEFSDALDDWENEHEDMGEFTIDLKYNDKNEVYLDFYNTEVNMDVVDKVCEDFNLRVVEKLTFENFYHGGTRVSFRLRYKNHHICYKKNDG